MTPSFLAIDVGNSSMKWGVFRGAENLSLFRLPPGDIGAWERTWQSLELPLHSRVLLSSVVPQTMERVVEWLARKGHPARVVAHNDIPMPMQVDNPGKTGIDRLLAAFAALRLDEAAPGAVTVNVGSAITVDLVLRDQGFQGGAILPGFRLMAQALHQNTAQLPEVLVPSAIPHREGKNTQDALTFGISHAILGAIRSITDHYRQSHARLGLFVSGGDGELFARALGAEYQFHSEMVLIGLAFLHGELVDV